MGKALEGWLREVLGRYDVVTRHRSTAQQSVLEVVDRDGRRWFGKQVSLLRHWEREVDACRALSPKLADQVAGLEAADRERQALLLTALPGQVADPFDVDVNRRAGRVLRRIHRSRGRRRGRPVVGPRVVNRLEMVLHRRPELFSPEETRFARDAARRMADLPARPRVFCHGDYKPHNWLVDDAGVVRVIDFAESRWHLPAYDLTRLYFGAWWDRPHLATAFLEGYGRPLDDAEEEFVRLHMVTNAAVAIWYGRTRGLPRRERLGRGRMRQLMEGRLVAG